MDVKENRKNFEVPPHLFILDEIHDYFPVFYHTEPMKGS